uniref:CD276 antigen-like n=1 Tax=Pristiophorus japonicus TaxID=55135 RepID=UPI00398F052B
MFKYKFLVLNFLVTRGMQAIQGSLPMFVTSRTCSVGLFTMYILLIQGSIAALLPTSPVIALFGRDLTLPCSFTPDPGISLLRLVVTWQLVGSERVVHSFYYRRDQLARQDPAYHNRTRLFPEALLAGNASLRLSGVRLDDQAVYMCSVSSEIGTSNAVMDLLVAAPCGEPQLTLDLRNCSGAGLVSLWALGGFPRPEVSWADQRGHNITHITETHFDRCPAGLYTVSSRLNHAGRAGAKYTFTLSNPLLDQRITRSMAILGSCDVTARPRRDRQHLLYGIIPAALITCVVLLTYFTHLRDRTTGRNLAV